MRIDEKEYTKSFEFKTWKRLFPYIKPFAPLLAMMVALNLACAAIDIALPLFQRAAIDNFIEKNTTNGLWLFAIVYALTICL